MRSPNGTLFLTFYTLLNYIRAFARSKSNLVKCYYKRADGLRFCVAELEVFWAADWKLCFWVNTGGLDYEFAVICSSR